MNNNNKDKLYAYTAGVVDSDGSITITKRTYQSKKRGFRQYFFPEIRVAMKSTVTINHLFSIFEMGKVYHQKDGTTLWHVYGFEALAVIKLIKEYQVTKRPQAELIEEFLESPTQPGEYYFERIREMKKEAYAS